MWRTEKSMAWGGERRGGKGRGGAWGVTGGNNRWLEVFCSLCQQCLPPGFRFTVEKKKKYIPQKRYIRLGRLLWYVDEDFPPRLLFEGRFKIAFARRSWSGCDEKSCFWLRVELAFFCAGGGWRPHYRRIESEGWKGAIKCEKNKRRKGKIVGKQKSSISGRLNVRSSYRMPIFLVSSPCCERVRENFTFRSLFKAIRGIGIHLNTFSKLRELNLISGGLISAWESRRLWFVSVV